MTLLQRVELFARRVVPILGSVVAVGCLLFPATTKTPPPVFPSIVFQIGMWAIPVALFWSLVWCVTAVVLRLNPPHDPADDPEDES